jgi:hypothetical protein
MRRDEKGGLARAVDDETLPLLSKSVEGAISDNVGKSVVDPKRLVSGNAT